MYSPVDVVKCMQFVDKIGHNDSGTHLNCDCEGGREKKQSHQGQDLGQEDCTLIVEIAVGMLRLQRFDNLHIRLVVLPRVREVALVLPQGNGTRMIELVRMQGVHSDC